MGAVNWPGEIKIHTDDPLHYRNRAQWAVSNANPRALGYCRRRATPSVARRSLRRLAPPPGLADALPRLQEITRSGISLPAEVLPIEAFVDSSDAKIALNVAFKEFRNPLAGTD